MFRCADRARKRLQDVGEWRLTKIAVAILRSQAAANFCRGLVDGVSHAKNLLSATLFSSDDDHKKEENIILKNSLVTNTLYYATPIAISLGVRYMIKQIPFVEDSGVEGLISHSISLATSGLFIRRWVDNSLSLATVVRAHTDSLSREPILETFDKMLPDVCAVLSRAFCRPRQEVELKEIIFSEVNEALRKYFSDPDLFRNLSYKQLNQLAIADVTKAFERALKNTSSAISPLVIPAPLAEVLVNLIFSRLVSDFKKQDDELKLLKKLFDSVNLHNAKDLAQDVLNHLNVHTEKKSLAVLPAEEKCDCPVDPDFEHQQKCAAEPDALFINVAKSISELVFIGLVRKYVPFGYYISIVLTAQMYGRGFLDLQLAKRCIDRRAEILSANKSLAIGLGLPIACCEALALHASNSFFIMDAVGNMLLQTWTIAQLKNKTSLKWDARGHDLFSIPVIPRDILYSAISSISFKRGRPKRLISRIKKISRSPQLHWVIAILFGDWRKLPKLRFVPNTFDALLEHGVSRKLITVRTHPDAVSILLKQVPSIQQFLKFYGNDIAHVIKNMRWARTFQPWRLMPILSFWQHNAFVSLVSWGLRLLKEDDVFRLLNLIHGEIENTKNTKLQSEEQTAAPDALLTQVNAESEHFTEEKKETKEMVVPEVISPADIAWASPSTVTVIPPPCPTFFAKSHSLAHALNEAAQKDEFFKLSPEKEAVKQPASTWGLWKTVKSAGRAVGILPPKKKL